MIHIGKPIELDEDSFFEDLKELKEEAYKEKNEIKEFVKKMVPTYNYKNIKKEKVAVTK